jgi:hypothetical protein
MYFLLEQKSISLTAGFVNIWQMQRLKSVIKDILSMEWKQTIHHTLSRLNDGI